MMAEANLMTPYIQIESKTLVRAAFHAQKKI